MTGHIELHDATLETIEIKWEQGQAVLSFRVASGELQRIVASDLARLECSRDMPWGISRSINEVRHAVSERDGLSVLEVEVQSGDIVRIHARQFRLDETPT